LGLSGTGVAEESYLPRLEGVLNASYGSPPAAPGSGSFATGLVVPVVRPGVEARAVARRFVETLEADSGHQPRLEALERHVPGLLPSIESMFTKDHFEKRDAGVAAAYFFIACYETVSGTVLNEPSSDAAARTIAAASAARWRDSYNQLPDGQKEITYERLLIVPSLLMSMSINFRGANDSGNLRSIRRATAEVFKAVFGDEVTAITVDPISGRIRRLSQAEALNRTRALSASQESSDSLVAPRPLEARVLIMYRVPLMIEPSPLNELFLFPNGIAVDAVPKEPVADFSLNGLRRVLGPASFGTWHQSGGRLTLTFRGKAVSYVKDPNTGGWADPHLRKSFRDPGYWYTYFPVIPVTRSGLLEERRPDSPRLSRRSHSDGCCRQGGRYGDQGRRHLREVRAELCVGHDCQPRPCLSSRGGRRGRTEAQELHGRQMAT
jgi:hypothetical protein